MTAEGWDERNRENIFRSLLWAGLFVQALLAVWATRPWMAGDSSAYLGLARNLAHGCFGIIRAGICQADALRPPGYPLVLAAEVHGIGLPFAVVAVSQVGLYLLSIFLMERLLARLRVSSLPLLAAALIYPFGAIYSAAIMTEAWATLAVSAVAFLMCTHPKGRGTAIAVGLISGAAALIRSDLLLLPLLLALLLFAQHFRSSGLRASFGHAMLPLLAAAFVLLPYAAWNASHFDKPSPAPVASAVGNTLYLAVWQSRLSHEDLEPLYRCKVTAAVAASGLVPEMMKINRTIGAKPLTVPFNPAAYEDQEAQAASSRLFGRAALEHIKAAPGVYGAHVAANLWLLWNTSIYPAAVPPIGRAVLRIVSALVLIAGLLGLGIAMISDRRRGLLPAAALLLYMPAIHIWLHTEARYTAAARPLLLMFAAIFAAFAAKRIGHHFGQPAARGGNAPPNGEKGGDKARVS